MSVNRRFKAGVGLSPVTATAVTTLMIEMSASDAAQLHVIDPKIRKPRADMEAELADASSPSTIVVVDTQTRPPILMMAGHPFLELSVAALPQNWVIDARAQGRCLLLFGSDAHQRHVWASVR